MDREPSEEVGRTPRTGSDERVSFLETIFASSTEHAIVATDLEGTMGAAT